MENVLKVIGTVLLLAFVGFIYYGIRQVESENPQGIYAEIAQMRADPEYQAQKAAEDAATAETGKTVMIVVVIGMVVLIVGGEIAHSKIGVPVLVIVAIVAVVLGVSYFFTYGDKTGDGVGDTQILVMVQPSGNPQVDAQYAEINNANAEATAVNVVSIVLYIFIFIVVLIVAAFIGLSLHAAAKGY